MRPITRGPALRSYMKYSDAQPDLIKKLGRFCSYCERKIPSGVAVEHKRPKSKYPLEKLKWDNFLLSCPNCNSTKLDRKINLSDYLWADTDNTARAFNYTEHGIVHVNKLLPKRARRKASRTLYMLGLDKHPGSCRKPTDRDYRWQDRRQQWEKAVMARDQLKYHDTPEQREMILKFAQDGIFSIWMEVFKDDVNMRLSLVKSFPGTAIDCFDTNCKPVARVGGFI